MTAGRVAPPELQPESFAFTPENRALAERIIAKYPEGKQQSAAIPLLDLAQRQCDNWLPRAAMDHVADLLEVPRIRIYEVASFYTMFNRAPVGRYFLQVCTTTPCWLRGSSDVMRAIRDRTGCGNHETSADGTFSVLEVECLGACVNAPMMQVNDDFYEDLDYDRTCRLIDALAAGEKPQIGSVIGRAGSEPVGGATTLTALRAGAARPSVVGEGQPAQPAPADGGEPPPPEDVAESLREPGATRGDATPQKKARPQEKIDPPGDAERSGETGEG